MAALAVGYTGLRHCIHVLPYSDGNYGNLRRGLVQAGGNLCAASCFNGILRFVLVKETVPVDAGQ